MRLQCALFSCAIYAREEFSATEKLSQPSWSSSSIVKYENEKRVALKKVTLHGFKALWNRVLRAAHAVFIT